MSEQNEHPVLGVIYGIDEEVQKGFRAVQGVVEKFGRRGVGWLSEYNYQSMVRTYVTSLSINELSTDPSESDATEDRFIKKVLKNLRIETRIKSQDPVRAMRLGIVLVTQQLVTYLDRNKNADNKKRVRISGTARKVFLEGSKLAQEAQGVTYDPIFVHSTAASILRANDREEINNHLIRFLNDPPLKPQTA